MALYRDSNVSLEECTQCGTIQIAHCSPKERDHTKHDDWADRFYLEDKRLSSLLQTRRRQARKILKQLNRLADKDSLLVDYGFGLGIFLQEASRSGFSNLSGIETSRIALERISKELPTAKVFLDARTDRTAHISLNIAPASKSTLAALDVIEHLDGWQLQQFPEVAGPTQRPRLVVIKVPTADGVLFRIAIFLARARISKMPLYQLLQIGDSSPHITYFTTRGLEKLLNRKGYYMTRVLRDLDYEVLTFNARSGAQNALARALGYLVIPIMALATKAIGREDSVIALFRRRLP